MLSAFREKVKRECKRVLAQLRKAVLAVRIGERWEGTSDGGTSRRVYPDYETYLRHQRLKLDAHREKSIRRHDSRFQAALAERLSQLGQSLSGRSVLCLAARQGSEVKAFIDRGAFAVGIDQNPGAMNRYVVVGDFHDLQFASGSVDVVYTNSLDHVFELDRVLAEIVRVLRSDGRLIVEVGHGAGAGSGPGFYESFSWRNTDELTRSFEERGFHVEERRRFGIPWDGEQIVLRRGEVPQRWVRRHRPGADAGNRSAARDQETALGVHAPGAASHCLPEPSRKAILRDGSGSGRGRGRDPGRRPHPQNWGHFS
jgi:SAM-dependent methyltransferase